MNQEIITAALELQGFIWENCPNLKGTSFTNHDSLIDMVFTFESDIDACKAALESVNTYFKA
jgi:hypothetical protein|tara:strand:- start:298 stop:483 length:186 start_codon:yes stop_codon:yes gene_type:complete